WRIPLGVGSLGALRESRRNRVLGKSLAPRRADPRRLGRACARGTRRTCGTGSGIPAAVRRPSLAARSTDMGGGHACADRGVGYRSASARVDAPVPASVVRGVVRPVSCLLGGPTAHVRRRFRLHRARVHARSRGSVSRVDDAGGDGRCPLRRSVAPSSRPRRRRRAPPAFRANGPSPGSEGVRRYVGMTASSGSVRAGGDGAVFVRDESRNAPPITAAKATIRAAPIQQPGKGPWKTSMPAAVGGGFVRKGAGRGSGGGPPR